MAPALAPTARSAHLEAFASVTARRWQHSCR